MTNAAARRRIGLGDAVVSAGLLATLLLMVFLFIEADAPQGYEGTGLGAWAIIAMVIFALAYLVTVAAYGLSFLYESALLAVMAFGGLQVAQACFRIFPLGSAARGVDLLWLMAGGAVLLGAELSRRGMLQIQTTAAPAAPEANERPPEARMKQLKQLHDSGLLSDTEYAEGRKQVLSALNR